MCSLHVLSISPFDTLVRFALVSIKRVIGSGRGIYPYFDEIVRQSE